MNTEAVGPLRRRMTADVTNGSGERGRSCRSTSRRSLRTSRTGQPWLMNGPSSLPPHRPASINSTMLGMSMAYTLEGRVAED